MGVNSSDRASVGMHCLIDFYEVDRDMLLDADGASDAMLRAAERCGMTALSDPACFRFPGGGFTAYLPLAESHIAAHSYPEIGYIAIDVFTCGYCDPDVAIAVLSDYFRPGRSEIVRVERGTQIEIAPPR